MRYVYAIRFGKYVKIGCSTQPAARFRALPGTLVKPADLDLLDREPLCAFPGEYETERFFHELFREYRTAGEFFELPEAWVGKLRSCSTDDQRAEQFNLADQKLPITMAEGVVSEVDVDF